MKVNTPYHVIRSEFVAKGNGNALLTGPLKGSLPYVNYQGRVETWEANFDHVADAFRQRRWLVQIVFAQRTFVVAVDSAEAQNEEQAIAIAQRRSRNFNEPLGDMISANAIADTPSNRSLLRADGADMDRRVEPRSRRWYDAA